MAFSIIPTTSASGATIVAKGTGTKKRPTRIRINNVLVSEFIMPGNSQFTKSIVVPSLINGAYSVVLQQQGTDLVWRQTASTSLTVQNPVTPPPPITAIQTITEGSTLNGTVTWLVTFIGTQPFRVDMIIDGTIKWPELYPEWGGSLDTTTLSNASHLFTIKAYDNNNNLLITSSVSATVNNVIGTLPPAPLNLRATAGDRNVTLAWGA